MNSHKHSRYDYLDSRQDIITELETQGIIGKHFYDAPNSRIYDSTHNKNNVIKLFNYKIMDKETIIKRKNEFINEIITIDYLNKTIKDGMTQIINSNCSESDDNYILYYEMPRYEKYNPRKNVTEILIDFVQLFDTLSKIHQLKYVHLDIKPNNIMTYNNKPIIIDFGCSRKNDSKIELPKGPKWFKPPELLSEYTDKNGLNFDADYEKSDIYMMSKTLWAVLQGDMYAERGFFGDYSRNYLQNIAMKINVNCEPLHLLFENSIISDWGKRLSIENCKRLLQYQVDILNKQYDRYNTDANYDLLKSIHHQKPSRLVFTDSTKYEEMLKKMTKLTIIRLSDTREISFDGIVNFDKELWDTIDKNHYIIKCDNKLIHISIKELEIYKASEDQFVIKLRLDDMDHIKDKYKLLMSVNEMGPNELNAINYLDSDYEIQVKLDSEYEKLSLNVLFQT